MKDNRLFRILYYILEKEKVTANELADKFEVSVRTIYRDIDSISSVGVPIFTTQGKGGGIKIDNEYILNKSLFVKIYFVLCLWEIFLMFAGVDLLLNILKIE